MGILCYYNYYLKNLCVGELDRVKRYFKFKTLSLIVVLLLLGTIGNIWISLNWLTIHFYECKTSKLSAEQELKIVILSDLHGHEFGKDNGRLIKQVKEQQPDLILLLGDMLNDTSKDTFSVCELISVLRNMAPVYYALGNHEIGFMEQHMTLLEEIEQAGARVLDEAYVDLDINGEEIRLGGMYAYAFGLNANNDAEAAPEDVKDFLEEYQDTDRFKIMMAHRPDSFIFGDAASVWDVDLVVSGHDHGGQVVAPFAGGLYGGDQGWFPEYIHGMYEKDGLQLFVTSGLGSQKQLLPRFNNPPEIAVITCSGN